ncbi:hypothetical protein K1719_012121 [Acacia pycnantha]|nr:hypothetical protein K1719_012121 [Acacia pycnantha]
MHQNSQFLIEEVIDDFVLVMADQEEQEHLEKNKKQESMELIDENSPFLPMDAKVELVLKHSRVYDEEEEEHEEDPKQEFMEQRDNVEESISVKKSMRNIWSTWMKNLCIKPWTRISTWFSNIQKYMMMMMKNTRKHKEDNKQEYMEQMDKKSLHQTMDENLDLVLKYSGIYDDDDDEEEHEEDNKQEYMEHMEQMDEKSLYRIMDENLLLVLKHSGIYDDDEKEEEEEHEENNKQEYIEQMDEKSLFQIIDENLLLILKHSGIYDDDEKHEEDNKQEYMEQMDEISIFRFMDENLLLVLKHSRIYDDDDEHEED